MSVNALPRNLLVLLVSALVLLTYFWWSIAENLVYLITNVDAYSHGQLVPFISIWLIWNNRETLSETKLFPWFPGLLLLLGASLLWIVSEVGEVKLLGHIAYVTAIQALILSILGPNFFQRFLFPCLFLYLSIPIGEGLVPVMQDVTALLSVGLLALSGIQYTLDGVFITLPSGIYEVAAACAGVRFLFSSFVTGVLLAHLLYGGWKKRLLMVLASIVIPIFANVIRVYGIFLISEATDQSFAREVDHIVYGWGFLSAVLLMVIAVAYRFADTEIDDHPGKVWLPFSGKQSLQYAAIVAVVSLLLPFIATFLAPKSVLEPVAIKKLQAPECNNCGVRKVPGPNLHDRAMFNGVDAEYHANYRISADQIAVSAALVCPHRPDFSLLQIGNVPRGKGWLEYDEKVSSEREVLGMPFVENRYSRGDRQKYVWTSYYVSGTWMASPREVQLASALERLQKGATAGAMLVISFRVYDSSNSSSEMLEKLLSTFPPDSFLWEEIKPSQEGTIVCAE